MDSVDPSAADKDRPRVLDAMRSGEWLRTQWIARVAFDLGARPWNPRYGARVLAVLRPLEAGGKVERRETEETRIGPVADVIVALRIPRGEWRLRCAHYELCVDEFEKTRDQIRALPEAPASGPGPIVDPHDHRCRSHSDPPQRGPRGQMGRS